MSDDRPQANPPRQADQKFCFSCGKLMHITANSCPSCGAHQPGEQSTAVALPVATRTDLVAIRPPPVGLPSAQAMFCYGCGAQIHRAAAACPVCGAAQDRAGAAPRKDRTVAIVLAFLLGGLGVHRFYLGNVGLGLLYLLFCWTLIPAIAAMIEGIVFVSTSDVDFQRKYGSGRAA